MKDRNQQERPRERQASGPAVAERPEGHEEREHPRERETPPPAAQPAKAKPAGPKTYAVRPTAAPQALAIYCVDPRFHAATEEFLAAELGLEKHEYIPLEIPGGVAALNLAELPKEAKYVRDQIAFALEHFPSVRTVVFVSHEDCGKYKALQKGLPHVFGFVKNLLDRQRLDLKRGAELLAQFAPRHVEVARYHAKFANSERTEVVFERQT